MSVTHGGALMKYSVIALIYAREMHGHGIPITKINMITIMVGTPIAQMLQSLLQEQ